MRITIVMGFFLPVPPLAGGATEKSWDILSREFAKRGHDVTVISRRWNQLRNVELREGVRHLRLPGYSHTSNLLTNLWRDLLWSLRVWKALPDADVTVVNCVTLPLWLGRFRRGAGKIVLMPGRTPKGQFRHYAPVDRVLAVSSSMLGALLIENPGLASVTRLSGYPINWEGLACAQIERGDVITIGYVGRLHQEKGLDQLVAAVALLSRLPDLGTWRVILCGPADIARGGSGPNYLSTLEIAFRSLLPPQQWSILPPNFDEGALATIYRSIDVFCYPSTSAGETFGVAVAEAMASGAVPVVSQLACFTDFVRDGHNGLTFDHTAGDAAAHLADCLAKLLRDPLLRARLKQAAQSDARQYDFPEFASRLLEDFSALK